MRIGWEECDAESVLITRVLGMGCPDHEEGASTHVRREYTEGSV
jgi:hypothetical protein